MADILPKELNEFNIVFDGQLNQVDLQTFTSCLLNISTLVQEINADVNPTNTIEINIHALEKGSFCAGLSIQDATRTATSLFQSGGLQTAATLIAMLVGLLTIKQFLGGDKPEATEITGDKVKIKNKNGNTNIYDFRTYNLYKNNQNINDAISANFEALADDPNVTKFEISGSGERFEAGVKDFPEMAKRIEAEAVAKKEIIDENARLYLHRVVFEDRYKWQFYYEGNKISANIVDEGFLKRVDEGVESFAKGDSLIVKLQINQIFNDDAQVYVNHSYQVNKVHEHIPRDEQLGLEGS